MTGIIQPVSIATTGTLYPPSVWNQMISFTNFICIIYKNLAIDFNTDLNYLFFIKSSLLVMLVCLLIIISKQIIFSLMYMPEHASEAEWSDASLNIVLSAKAVHSLAHGPSECSTQVLLMLTSKTTFTQILLQH